MPQPVQPPRPERRETTRSHHGDTVIDPYEWLRDKDNPVVIAHLEAENAYADAVTAHLEPVREAIFTEIKRHTQETDLSVPVKDGDYWYLTRTAEGQQYPTMSRLPVTDPDQLPQLVPGELLPGEQVILDCPALAEGQAFFSLGGIATSVDHSRLAYALDVAGDERFDVVVTDPATGETVDDVVTNVGYGLAFSQDASVVFYTRVDDAWRHNQIWRHTIGQPADTDTLVLREDDERFSLGFQTSRDGRWLTVMSGSTTTAQWWVLDLATPHAEPVMVAERRDGLEYRLEVAGDELLVVHNLRHEGFELARAPWGTSTPEHWETLLVPEPGERFDTVDHFDSALALTLRSGGLAGVRIIPAGEEGWRTDATWDIGADGELNTIELDENREPAATRIRYELTSLVVPPTVCEVDLATGESTVLRQTPVPGYDPGHYVERRLWATAEDGTQIPISLVARADLTPDGRNPGFLYGYGAYEVSVDPDFSASRLSLLDRGVVYAIAHVRGGGELGRAWYEGGKLDRKKNSFSDFVACANALVESGWVAADRLAAEGRSAGGLLMGAITNLAPERFRVVLAGVPFVDALTTILDPSLPLTVGEWEEWGDPLHDAEVYAYMKSYSPYENIAATHYPAIMATTSLNDTRVEFVEPTKWVARLRDTVTSDQTERPIIYRCEMVAGHGGRSGRYDRWRQRADELAFVLDQIGAVDLPSSDVLGAAGQR
ncbi:S9 family peptidase [Parenemella sanctibonifatiensis]|uniref:Oligopeptidase B n=1 Tax=Parenemella sanctibonifatiensis TaxID=2016505 RepID=A0A255EHP4_9ACTN|nr:S9 family peptidase [Parenemella sanctibonifatiensis]OYN89145.1 oligopeptidase B [Parenemella sanctibonifatiensis]